MQSLTNPPITKAETLVSSATRETTLNIGFLRNDFIFNSSLLQNCLTNASNNKSPETLAYSVTREIIVKYVIAEIITVMIK